MAEHGFVFSNYQSDKEKFFFGLRPDRLSMICVSLFDTTLYIGSYIGAEQREKWKRNREKTLSENEINSGRCDAMGVHGELLLTIEKVLFVGDRSLTRLLSRTKYILLQ